jgi:hypothetical protein
MMSHSIRNSAVVVAFTCAVIFVAVASGRAQVLQPGGSGTSGASSGATAANGSTETNRPPIIPFLEGTDVFWSLQSGKEGRPKFPSVLEADIFPHLVVYQNFTDLVDIDKLAEERRFRNFAISISGTPAVRIRMLRETSNPVRTPSYMPRGNFQLLWARNLRGQIMERATVKARERGAIESAAPATPTTPAGAQPKVERGDVESAAAALPQVSLWEAHVIIGHHSNGQDGCLSEDQEREIFPDGTKGDCFPAGITPTAETVNRVDGSFSTNYIRSGINYSRNWMTGTKELQAVKEIRARVELEYHPSGWVDEDMVELYGRTRLNLGAAWALKNVKGCQRRLEVSGATVWNPGVVETVPEWSGNLQLSCFPWDNGGWGFFARLYTGQDYYNVGFLDKITRLQFGLTFNQTGFFRFRKRPATPTN